MSVLVNAVIVTVLWLIGHFLSQWMLNQTFCLYSSTLLFSWWFVAYFTKNININLITLIATYIVLNAAIMSAHYSGRIHQLFPTIPFSPSSNIWLSFMVLALVMVTPLIFNLIIRYVTKAANAVS